ncbi:hypothetical protein DdX_21278 [Ditylenchus destructor]|uniref:Uncharacterized protein n=1 Tax=Ditylenchus destructor TaxID=166010 RepID=A0AAD4MF45_9BILA|nr:hypothetical protein DdX_21278 [Ditylenchus destructor]
MLGLLLILAVLGTALYLHFQLSRAADAAKMKKLDSARNATLAQSTTTAMPKEMMRATSSQLHRFVESLPVSTPEQSEMQVSIR